MPIILGEVKDEVMSTMAIMLVIAVALMIVVLFLVFRVRRRVMMSLAFVLIGLIWAFGFMGWPVSQLQLLPWLHCPSLLDWEPTSAFNSTIDMKKS
ncbi:hypothetical protein [Paenibacillus alvei]|uniref:hypothetical protein n=1 Tax=Paenibacillus alvei TaxID=44250 RepID=UPI002378F0D3|nr:hypothetical protein [Paenibacillus alvei]